MGACGMESAKSGLMISVTRGAQTECSQNDAGSSVNLSQVALFVGEWRAGSELVMGNRFRGEVKPGAMPGLHKHLGNPAITAILNKFFHAGVGDAYCGMRGFTKRVYLQIDPRTTGMEFA